MIFTKQSQHVLIGLYFVFLVGFLQPVKSLVCTTKNCHTLGRHLRENIKTTVQPCVNFYEYACGGWAQKHPVPEGYRTFSRSADNLKNLENQLVGLLQEKISPTDLNAVKTAKLQFQTCINDDILRAQGLRSLISIIKESGGWPMIESNTFVSQKGWQEVHDNYLLKTGIGSIINILLQVKSDYSTIVVDQGSPLFELPFDPSDIVQVEKRLGFIIEVAQQFAAENKANIDRKLIDEDAKQIHKIDQALSNLRNTESWRHIGQPMTIDSANTFMVSNITIGFDLYTGIQKIFSSVPGERSFHRKRVILLREREYLRGAMQALSSFTDRDILNYIHFHFVVRQIYRTTPELRNLYTKYYNIKPSNRTISCMKEENLKTVLSNMYLKRYFSPTDKRGAETVVNDVKATIEKQIKHSDWIDKESMPAAIDKLKHLDQSIGYRSYFADDKNIEHIYSKYKMGESFVLNVLNYKESVYKHYLSQFGSKSTRDKTILKPSVYPIDLSSLYQIRSNRLDIPATNLQVPFFSNTLPYLANYAGAGAMVANQLATMYNDVGIHFDGYGNVVEWLSAKAANKYDERYGCYGKQLVNYTHDALHKAGINHKLISPPTIPPNFMDSFALETAYDAYQDRVLKSKQSSIELPGLEEYNAEKQFFLAYANPFCESTTETSLRDLIVSVSNLPAAARVNIAVSNSPVFSKVFQCPEGSPMNPKIKCRIFS